MKKQKMTDKDYTAICGCIFLFSMIGSIVYLSPKTDYEESRYIIKAHKSGHKFNDFRRAVVSELLKAKEKNPNKSYSDLLGAVRNKQVKRHSNECIGCKDYHDEKCPESKPFFVPNFSEEYPLRMSHLVDMTCQETYSLLKQTPENEQKLMLLGYMAEKDGRITNYTDASEMKMRSRFFIQKAYKQLEQAILSNNQKTRN